jgi:hypothetical protein
VQSYAPEWTRENSTILGVSIFVVILLGVYLLASGYVQYLRVLAHARRAILGQSFQPGRLSWLRLAGAVVLLAAGGWAVQWGWLEWRLRSEYQAEVTEVSFEDLVQNRFGPNRHVVVKNLRVCNGWFQEVDWLGGHPQRFWIVVLPAGSKDIVEEKVRIDIEGTPRMHVHEPRRARVLITYVGGAELAPGDFERNKVPQIEAHGYEGAVINGLGSPTASVRRRLMERCPETTWDEVIFLDRTAVPAGPGAVFGCLGGGFMTLALGFLLLARARRPLPPAPASSPPAAN